MTTTHSFVTTCSLVIRCTRPPAISPEEFGTSHNIAIIKKNLRSRMSFTPGNGISNEVPSNCGISIEVSRRTLPSLSSVCLRSWCVLLLLTFYSAAAAASIRFFRLLRTTNCAVTGFLVSLLYFWPVIFHPAMRRFISSLPNHTID